MWHVSSRSGVATLQTAIHLLFTYLLTIHVLCIKLTYLLSLTPMHARTHAHTHTHAHTQTHTFNDPFSGTTQVSRYQKGKINLDFVEARDSEWQWNQLGHMQVCTSFQTDNHACTSPLSFLHDGCPSCHPTNSVKALKASNEVV